MHAIMHCTYTWHTISHISVLRNCTQLPRSLHQYLQMTTSSAATTAPAARCQCNLRLPPNAWPGARAPMHVVEAVSANSPSTTASGMSMGTSNSISSSRYASEHCRATRTMRTAIVARRRQGVGRRRASDDWVAQCNTASRQPDSEQAVAGSGKHAQAGASWRLREACAAAGSRGNLRPRDRRRRTSPIPCETDSLCSQRPFVAYHAGLNVHLYVVNVKSHFPSISASSAGKITVRVHLFPSVVNGIGNVPGESCAC